MEKNSGVCTIITCFASAQGRLGAVVLTAEEWEWNACICICKAAATVSSDWRGVMGYLSVCLIRAVVFKTVCE